MGSSIRKLSRIEPTRPLLLAAWPGMGNVAYGAAVYIKENLAVEKFAEMVPEGIFYRTGVQIKEGIVSIPELPRGEFYYYKNSSVPNEFLKGKPGTGQFAAHDILMFIGESQPVMEKEYDLSMGIVEVAREYPEKSCREVAFHITDKEGYFISESSVYRILKAHNLVASPVFTVISAKDEFEHPTHRVNELWQSDFTYLKVIDWGWYYLSTVLDDYSRYIIAWRLCLNMTAAEVAKTLDMAIARTGVKHVHVFHRPRLLSDNGPCFISQELKDYLEDHNIRHIRTRTYHPMTQGYGESIVM